MTAALTMGHGGLDMIKVKDDVPVPKPKPGEVLIRVAACGANNTDINTRTAWYSRNVTDGTSASGGSEGFAEIDKEGASWGRTSIKFPLIQGADVCGRVVAVGDGTPETLIGKRVLVDTWLRDWDDPHNKEMGGYYGSEHNGGYAQYAIAPKQNVHPIESSYTDVELATFATAYVTAENMLRRANVVKGDVVLIPGASGGVGSALIQLCLRRGAKPVAMSGASKAEQVKALGPIAVLDRSPGDLGAALKGAIGRDTVDVVADVVGGPMFKQFIEVLVKGGRYTCSGAIAGPMVELDLRTFYLKDLTFTGATMVPPDLFGKLVGYIERGEVKPLVAATYPLSEIHAAQEAFLAKKFIGNIVLVPPSD